MATEFEPGAAVGSYRVHHLLAQGGMAMVYDAAHRILPRRVALKVMHQHLLDRPEAAQRLLQEACILEAFAHPGAVRVFDCGVLPDRRPWIAMEYVGGESLAALFARAGALPIATVVGLMTAIADVIAAADRAGIVHRDLKPENVLVVDPAGGEVRVIDWGIAHHPVGPRLTLENLSLGTPTYIAPEQALGRPVDGRADVYALGVIAYEAVVGRPPFASDHALAMVLKHLLEAPPPVRAQRPDVPCCLAALIEAMLAKDPEHRPTAREVRARLAPLQAGAAPVACDHDDALGAYCELVVTDAATEDAPAFEVLPPPATTWQRDPAWAGRRAPRAARAAAIVDV